MTRHFTTLLCLLPIILSLVLVEPYKSVPAQSPDGGWTDFENISNTPTASTFPCIAADAQGYVHVLWSEDVGGVTSNLELNQNGIPVLDSRGNPVNRLTDDGNTLYYTRWDGIEWSEPIDVQVNSGGKIEYPRIVVDPWGTLHAVWVSSGGGASQVMYSRVLASQADSPRDWSQPIALVEQSLFNFYPVDIAVDSDGGLHVLNFKLGDSSGVYVINSSDGGNTWSDPILLYPTLDPNGGREGVAPVSLLIDQKNRLHATWTRYGSDGNGKAIYYSRSTDLGNTWSQPFEVARWQPGWYETDWLSAGVVGDEVHLVWEGGQLAYLNERISTDSGLTWSENQHILPNLVGENGYANLALDSASKLHMIWVQRGNLAGSVHGIWYATWEDNHWVNPVLLGTRNLLLYWKLNSTDPVMRQSLGNLLSGTFTGGGLHYPMSAISDGNQLFVVIPNAYDGDIWSSHTTLNAPDIPPKPYPLPTALPALRPTSTLSEALSTPAPAVQFQTNEPVQEVRIQPAYILLFGVISALIIVAGIIFSIVIYKRR